MSAIIPEQFRDLLERPIIVTLVTIMPDGQPQASPVWFSYDGEHIWVNTARGRQKDKNMTERPRVTLLSVDPENPYRYLEVRGVIDGVDEAAGLDHINALSQRSRGIADYYSSNPQMRGKEQRVVYKVRPTRVIGH